MGWWKLPGDALERARRALAEARADAAAKGVRQPRPGESARQGEHAGADGSERLRGLARGRRDDPQPLGMAIEGLLAEHGWEERAAVGGAFGRWEQIVGADLAAHTYPESFTEGELVVMADSTAWATQLRLLAADLVRRLNAELGDGTVRRVNVRGPAGAAGPRRGGWRVQGGRGPRDTYG
jgi:predicted nucleic acid-binding Zn ribbon protein